MNIEELISLYLDGELSSEAEGELHYQLAVSPDDRKVFHELIALRSVARDQRVLHVPDSGMRSALFERLQREEGMKTVPAIPLPALTQSKRTDSTPYGAARPPIEPERRERRAERRRRRVIPLLLSLLLLVIASGVTWDVWNDGSTNREGTIAALKETPNGLRPAAPSVAAQHPTTPPEIGTVAADSATIAASATSEPTVAYGVTTSRNSDRTRQRDNADMSGATIAFADAAGASAPPASEYSVSAEPSNIGSTDLGDNARSSSMSITSDTTMVMSNDTAPSLLAYDEEGGESLGADLSVTALGATLSNTMQSGLSNGNPRGRKIGPQLLGPTSTVTSIQTESTKAPPKILLGATMIGSGGGMRIGGGHPDSLAVHTTPLPLAPYRSLSIDQGGPTFTRMDGSTTASPKESADQPFRQRSAAGSENAPIFSQEQGNATAMTSANDSLKISSASDNLVSAPVSSMEPSYLPRKYFTEIGGRMTRNLDNSTVAPDLSLRFGVDFDEGRQRVYLAAGYSGFREQSVTTVTSIRQIGPTLESSTTANHSAEIAYEVWGGGGYSYTAWFDNLGVGGGISISVGSQYIRAGAELPVSLRIGDRIRFDVGPSIQYARAIDSSPRTSTSGRIDPTVPFSKQTVQVTTKDQEEVKAGVGLGAGMTLILR